MPAAARVHAPAAAMNRDVVVFGMATPGLIALRPVSLPAIRQRSAVPSWRRIHHQKCAVICGGIGALCDVDLVGNVVAREGRTPSLVLSLVRGTGTAPVDRGRSPA